MPLTNARRPKYEKKDIKQNLFTIQLSLQRLDKVKRLLKDKDIDGLIVIIGIDGRFNSGSLEIFNYLLFDIYSTRQDDIIRSKLDEDVFDDVMLCIQKEEVHVYCNGSNYWLLLPYISHWTGLRLHCITELEMEDPDKAEDFKMKAFVEMTRSCNKIAVSTKASYDKNDEPFNPMQLEEWPIVQSYAYDNFGEYSHDNAKKGFFTLVHKVEDLSKDVSKICKQIDSVYLETVYTKILPQIHSLFENIFQLIDTKCCSTNFELDEKRLEEPVISYFSHYKGVSVTFKDRIKTYPFVLTGLNTRKHILQSKINSRLDDALSGRDSIVKNPTHLIIQCVSLQTGIIIARTAFLKNCPLLQMEDSVATFIDDSVKELSKVYNIIVKVAEYIIDNITKGKNMNLDSDDGEKYLNVLLKGTQCSDYILRIQSVNNDSHKDNFLVIFQVVVFDVISKITKENLGSVMFADTFVVSNIPLNTSENLNSVLRLGKEVPIFSYWSNQRLSEFHSQIRVAYEVDSLRCENIDILLPNDCFHEDFAENVCCTLYMNCMMLFNKRIGVSIIYPKSIQIFEGKKYGDWTILTLNFERDGNLSNWIWNHNDRGNIHLIFTNQSDSRKFVSNFIQHWKETIPIVNVDNLQCTFLSKSWINIQYWMSSNSLSDIEDRKHSIIEGISEDSNVSSISKILKHMNTSVTNRKSCFRIFCQLMELNYSLHYINTVNYIEEIPCKSINLYESLEQHWNSFNIIDHKKLRPLQRKFHDTIISPIIVTVICGLPGSGYDLVGKKITKLIKEDISWILVDTNSLDSIPSTVERSINRFNKLNVSGEGRQMRMILIAPPMCGPSLIYEVLMGFKTQIPLEIGSSCFCIDPQAAFLDNHELTIPGLLDMCAVGWVTCILLTGIDSDSPQTNNLHRLLQSRNDFCTIYRTPKAEVNKELDTILSPVAFQQTRFALSRIINGIPLTGNDTSIECIRKISPELYEVTYPLYGKLSKENIISTCKELFKNIQACPVEQNIYFMHGIFGIKEDADQVYSFNAVALTKRILFLPLKKKQSGDDSFSGNSDHFIKVYTFSQYIESYLNKKDFGQIENWKLEILKILQNFQTHVPEKKKRILASDLTKIEVEKIHTLKHLNELPEGWFYNGLTYVHMDGSKSEKHPSLQHFIQDFVKEENTKIDDFNYRIDKLSFCDSFKKC